MAKTPVSAPPRGELLRALGVSHATAIVVGTIIGSGIFRVPGTMMLAVGSAKYVYLAWLVGGILSFFGALTFAELGAMRPQSGGEYVYIRDAYGPLPGFLYCWSWFVVAKPASIATVTTGLADALSALPWFRFLADPIFTSPFPVMWSQLVAILAAVLISGLNYIGVKRAGTFQLVFTILKVAMLVGIAVVGFTYSAGTWANFSTTSPARGGFAGFMVALVAALWAYDGWNDLNMVGEEVKDPGKSIPIALISGVAIVGVLYVLMNAAIQYVLPAIDIAKSKSPAASMMLVAVGAGGAAVITAGIALSMLVTLNGTIMSGARIPFAAARDGYFFKTLAHVHPRFHTPGAAIVVQLMLSVALLLTPARFVAFLGLAIFAEWLFYMISTSTVFVFRKKEPDAPRPYKTWGYPVVPALFIAAAAVLLVYTFAENLREEPVLTWVSVAFLAAGVPAFYYFAAKRKAGGSPA
ncbi:MAG: amino acid permease [Acidobacteriota bacterium]|nr:amino acid permease [Acidobacteriota bacterium]